MTRQRSTTRKQIGRTSSSPQNTFQTLLQSLLKQHKYRQALDEIQKARRTQPDLVVTPTEAEIWLLQGKQEFEKGDFKQAETSLRRSLQLGWVGDSHYWLAKCLLSLKRLDAAIAMMREAFEDGSLPKDYSVCYAKLLLLKGDTATVEQLLSKQSKRFPAAQQHWIRGALALKANQPEAALEFFQKIKRPITPSDRPQIWQIYALQAAEDWDAAALQLGFGLQTANLWGISLGNPTYNQHPILQRLALVQYLKTGQPPLEQLQFTVEQEELLDILNTLSTLEFIDDKNYHEAAHALLKVNRRPSKFPELATLRPALLTLAGEQALTENEGGCASQFWQLVQQEEPFNPQLAVNLMKVLDLNQDYQEFQRLVTQILKWLEKEFKQNPQDWPEDRRKETLVYGHCRLADIWMAMGRERTAMGELQKAERIDPRAPEVKGRHGLIANLEENYDEAIRLLTDALEEGCRYPEVYLVLIKIWKQLGKPEAALEARRRFGKKFGDLNPETDVEVLPWVEALSTRSYPLFSYLAEEGSEHDPAMRACQIFVEAVESEPNSGGNVSLNQDQAVQTWDQLLQTVSPKEQVPTLQAIALSILLFAKRAKGIAALLTKYMLKLYDLSDQQPEAREAHLVILALKDRDPKKLYVSLQEYLGTKPQPGNALAQLQLQVRRYVQSLLQGQILRPAIDEALKRESQNPLLLLAKATTYPPDSPNYEQLKQQGFEIARRVQDASALQAFREEEAFLKSQMLQEFLPSPDAFDDFDMNDMDELLETMIRKMFGDQIPPAELKRMLPQFKQMMNDMSPNLGADDDDDDDFGFPFGFAPPPPKPTKRRRR